MGASKTNEMIRIEKVRTEIRETVRITWNVVKKSVSWYMNGRALETCKSRVLSYGKGNAMKEKGRKSPDYWRMRSHTSIEEYD